MLLAKIARIVDGMDLTLLKESLHARRLFIASTKNTNHRPR
jgi:hypothetical protein